MSSNPQNEGDFSTEDDKTSGYYLVEWKSEANES
jgi:hypothetical protein